MCPGHSGAKSGKKAETGNSLWFHQVVAMTAENRCFSSRINQWWLNSTKLPTPNRYDSDSDASRTEAGHFAVLGKRPCEPMRRFEEMYSCRRNGGDLPLPLGVAVHSWRVRPQTHVKYVEPKINQVIHIYTAMCLCPCKLSGLGSMRFS